MRTIPFLTLLAGGLAVLATPARAQLLAYDGFGNGPAATLDGSTGGTGWTGAWLDGGTDPTGIGAGLSYPGLLTTAGGAVTPAATGVYPATYVSRSFPAPTGPLYVSFLLRDDAGVGIWGGLSFGQYPYAMTVGAPQGMYVFGLMMSQGLGDLTNRPLVVGETVLLVVRIAMTAPNHATYDLWLDPTVGAAMPALPDATYGVPAAALPTGLHLDNGTGFTTDEIRVGLSWNDVLPAAPPTWIDLGFAKPGVAGAPHLAGSGPFAVNTTSTLALTQAAPGAAGWLVIGFFVQNTPFVGGVLVPQPLLVWSLGVDAGGTCNVPIWLPPILPPGLPVDFQCWITDAAATYGYSASNGLQGIVQ